MLQIPEHVPAGSYAVILVTHMKKLDPEYEETARAMAELVKDMPGFLGTASWRDEGGRGVIISWWQDLDAINHWWDHPRHVEARQRAEKEWYDDWQVQICRVEKSFRKPSA